MAAAVLIAASAATAHSSYPSPRCGSAHFRGIARASFQPWWKPRTRRAQLKALKRCAPNYRTRQQMRGIEEDLATGRVLAIARYRRLTPYGRWAIPGWCVMAESGGSWTAHNPSSPARGAYQLLGHGEPWPVDSMADKMAHHRIARDLYVTSGLNPWVACS